MDDGIENLLKRDDPYGFDKKIVQMAKDLKPVLIFDSNYSAFIIENINNDEIINGAAALYFDSPNKLITDLKTKHSKRNNFGRIFKKNKYVIVDSLQTNWVLTNETKIVDEYKCYKATMSFSIESRKGMITAWYCPEIPFSFGPKGYGGLPGLIIELIDKRGILGLKKLSLSVPIDEKVLEIKGEEQISSEEYRKLVEKLIFDE